MSCSLRGSDTEYELTMKTWMLWTGRGLALATLTTITSLNLLAQPPIPDEYQTGGFAIGCQAYTFNRFSVFEAIEKTAQAGGKVIEF